MALLPKQNLRRSWNGGSAFKTKLKKMRQEDFVMVTKPSRQPAGTFRHGDKAPKMRQEDFVMVTKPSRQPAGTFRHGDKGLNNGFSGKQTLNITFNHKKHYSV
jgi:hypothetical protein